eukprot:2044043-Amphidinium_carterae.1
MATQLIRETTATLIDPNPPPGANGEYPSEWMDTRGGRPNVPRPPPLKELTVSTHGRTLLERGGFFAFVKHAACNAVGKYSSVCSGRLSFTMLLQLTRTSVCVFAPDSIPLLEPSAGAFTAPATPLHYPSRANSRRNKQVDYAYTRSSIPTHKKWQVHAILTCVEATIGLCMAIPTSRKGPTRHQLTQLKKFVMENGFGQSTIQADNEPAIKQLAEAAARELTIPWRQSLSHTHQGQGSVERFHQALFAQLRAIR